MRTLPEILDDIGDALDPQPPEAGEVEDIHKRLCGDMERLVSIAAAAENEDPELLGLVQRARILQATELPADQSRHFAHLRQQGAVANDLLERLTATGTIKQVA